MQSWQLNLLLHCLLPFSLSFCTERLAKLFGKSFFVSVANVSGEDAIDHIVRLIAIVKGELFAISNDSPLLSLKVYISPQADVWTDTDIVPVR